jgi:hypothetical protein
MAIVFHYEHHEPAQLHLPAAGGLNRDHPAAAE